MKRGLEELRQWCARNVIKVINIIRVINSGLVKVYFVRKQMLRRHLSGNESTGDVTDFLKGVVAIDNVGERGFVHTE